jgi:tetratricopeptide (TPR) repeat protein
VLVAGIVAVRMTWTWSQDDYAAGIVANRLLHAEPVPSGSFELPEAPSPSWWNSTPDHLHQRALALSRGEQNSDKSEEVRFLLSTARHAAPLDPAVRLASAGPSDVGTGTSSNFAMSRDVLTMRRTGQALLDAGKIEQAIRVDKEALEIAGRIELAHAALPQFIEDSRVRRFRLPHEETMEGIVRDLAAHRGWRFADWSRALPPNGLAALLAYRLLREQVDPEAESALAFLCDLPAPAGTAAERALVLAAQGEGLALAERWQEAADRYREAIALMPDDVIRRTWWINLGEIAARLRDTGLMQSAWAAARGPSPKDEINVRMIQARERHGFSASPKARTKAGQTKSQR